jgi:hypothetical protein
MSKHTPGPWFVPKENAGSAATSVWARGGDVRVADCNSGCIALPGRQCDARLIAAAPELLEACKDALRDLIADGHEHYRVAGTLIAAIAKAEQQ